MIDAGYKFESNFNFLENSFPILSNLGTTSEYYLFSDPIVTIIKIRQFSERVTDILFKEHGFEFPRDNTFHNRLKTLDFNKILPQRVKDLLYTIKSRGNDAVHNNYGSTEVAKTVLFSAFKIGKWLEETYGTYQHLETVRFTLLPTSMRSMRLAYWKKTTRLFW